MNVIKHDWILDESGEVDIWRLEADYHNGPQCARCREAFCHHCEPERYDEPCSEQTPYMF